MVFVKHHTVEKKFKAPFMLRASQRDLAKNMLKYSNICFGGYFVFPSQLYVIKERSQTNKRIGEAYNLYVIKTGKLSATL